METKLIFQKNFREDTLFYIANLTLEPQGEWSRESESETGWVSERPVLVLRDGQEVLGIRNPPHVHQPLIQTIVDELGGRGRCASTGESAARTSWVLDRCLGRAQER